MATSLPSRSFSRLLEYRGAISVEARQVPTGSTWPCGGPIHQGLCFKEETPCSWLGFTATECFALGHRAKGEVCEKCVHRTTFRKGQENIYILVHVHTYVQRQRDSERALKSTLHGSTVQASAARPSSPALQAQMVQDIGTAAAPQYAAPGMSSPQKTRKRAGH